MATGPITGNQYDIAGGTPAHRTARMEYWSEMAQHAIPPGSVIESIGYKHESGGDPLIITIKTPTGELVDVVPMRDDEWNGPGALHTWQETPGGDEEMHGILPTLEYVCW